MSLTFIKAENKEDIKKIYDYNIDAFSDSPGFNWTLDNINKEVSDGWQLYGAYQNDEIVAALFLQKNDKELLTKNTAIKISFQGSGYSHEIKEFFELKGREFDVGSILHYCAIDNFRMYSLNESHGYEKTDNRSGVNGEVVEWVKTLK